MFRFYIQDINTTQNKDTTSSAQTHFVQKIVHQQSKPTLYIVNKQLLCLIHIINTVTGLFSLTVIFRPSTLANGFSPS